MVPIFGLIAMGKGSFMQGIEQLTTVHAEKLNSVGGPTDPLPDWRGIYRFDSGEHLLLVYKSGHRATHAGVKKPGGRAKGGRC
ncbi:putative sodium:solute symporter [Escherichia coli]|uniref:Putative sodium:solute symporter n=1 Tax=Escherichia coli TaxID=562 RepID=A0A376LEI4_ECOLX|nr:putative sodium:solute symporter [Escherichia coli]